MHPVELRVFCICLCCLTVLCAGAIALEQAPPMPHVFYGTAYIGDQPVSAGALVEANGTGVPKNSEGNPIAVGTGGTYGGPGTFIPKLIVQGQIATGTGIEFSINGERAQCLDVQANSGWMMSYPFKPAGVTQLDLRVNSLPADNATTGNTTIMPTIIPTATASPTSTYYSSGGGGGGGSSSGSMSSLSSSTATQTTISTPTHTVFPTQNTSGPTTIATPVQKTQEQTVAITVMVTTTTLPVQTGESIPSLTQIAIGAVVFMVIVAVGLVYVVRKKNL